MTPLEVLKNKKRDIMLYSPCYGNVKFLKVNNLDYPIEFEDEKGNLHAVTAEGKIASGLSNTQVMLFPSINLKEWDKFDFKKGAILEHENGMEAVEFISYETSEENPANNYTMFKGKVVLPEEHKGEEDYFTTWCFMLRKRKAIKKSFHPFEKVMFINFGEYQLGFVERYCVETDTVYLINEEDRRSNLVYPYKEEMERFIGELVTDETENKIDEILENE